MAELRLEPASDKLSLTHFRRASMSPQPLTGEGDARTARGRGRAIAQADRGAGRPVAAIRSNNMPQTQSETLTRRDALATGATLLGATTFGTMALAADEPKSRRKVRIG